jgi:DNA-binding MarR family transcriptional regulator
MARVARDSVERRILDFLKTRYPVTVGEVQKALRINPKILERSVRKLASMGCIELDVLPDKTYIRLLIFEQ